MSSLKRFTCLPPIVNSDSKILILGTFPGNQSLLHEQYYAHGTNSFWKIIFDLFNQSPTESYESKINILINNKIALWDVVHSCSRKSSADKDIIDPTPNDIPGFLESHPTIKTLVITSTDTKNIC